MREGWKEVKLGEIINIKHGMVLKENFFLMKKQKTYF